jgi:two-component system osmolarity sensor histidine kinase EnvZ
LAKVEEDRAVMLAGISHDLRTPLARLRLETEMSVADMVARQHMAADIDQLDAIIDKFLDYARPGSTELQSVALSDVIHRSLYALGDWADVEVQLQLDDSLCVLAEEVELSRVFCNLLENARKYGKSLSTGATQVDVITSAMDKWVLIKIRDHGPGVPQEQLASLTKPFYRGEAARTAANGAGLGLAIVEKTVQRMGGVFLLTASPGGGLSANIKLQRAEDSPSKPLALGPR